MVQNNSLNKSSEDFTVDNLFLDGNTISTTNTNGNLLLSPDGTGYVAHERSLNGSDVIIFIENEDTTPAAASNARLAVQSASASAGDPYITTSIGATRSYCFGIDNSDSDILKVNTTAAGGVGPSTGTNVWKMTSAGERTMPLQPAFLAYLASTDNNVTGNGATYTFGDTDSFTALTEVFDQNGDLTPGASGGAIFQAPVTGKYFIEMEATFSQATNATQTDIRIVSSNRTYVYLNTFSASAATNAAMLQVLTDMDASDTITWTAALNGIGGNTADALGTANLRCHVSGFLSC